MSNVINVAKGGLSDAFNDGGMADYTADAYMKYLRGQEDELEEIDMVVESGRG